MGLSVVTVCMNRREHLLATVARLAAWPHHDEHLIVDWSSRTPLSREELPADPRLRLLRVEGEDRWNLCRAYNFGLAHASGGRLLKLDADAWPTDRFDPDDPRLRLGEGGPVCAFGSGPEGRKGQILIDAALLAAVGGFHELMVGYGFDDKDLQARLSRHCGQGPARGGRSGAAAWRWPRARRRCGPAGGPTGWWRPTAPGGRAAPPPATARRPRGCGGWRRARCRGRPRGWPPSCATNGA
ncbi:MAG: glycosyltransferase family 2 protein [Cyanobium sp.]